MRVVSTVFVVACSVLGVEGARACTCTYTPPFEVAYERSEAVFLGTVVDLQPVPGQYLVRATLQVDAYWKGEPGTSAHVVTSDWVGTCGFPFEIDRQYLIYADRDPTHGYSIHLCGRSHEPWVGDPDLVALGTPVPALPMSWGGIKRIYRAAAPR